MLCSHVGAHASAFLLYEESDWEFLFTVILTYILSLVTFLDSGLVSVGPKQMKTFLALAS
jgi:hypothetical protein